MSIGRNDPCPCGSGKKYKRCCGAARKEASTLELVPGSADDNPCRDQVWEADVVPVPIALDDDPAARPAGVLVVSGDQILAHDFMGQAPAEPEALAGILEEAVRRAAAEAGGLPGALWVRHESIKTALAAASGLKTVRLAAATSLPGGRTRCGCSPAGAQPLAIPAAARGTPPLTPPSRWAPTLTLPVQRRNLGA
jgi:hypothetical protein